MTDLDIVYSKIKVQVVTVCIASALTLVVSLLSFAILLAAVSLAELDKSKYSIRVINRSFVMIDGVCYILFASICAMSMVKWRALIDNALEEATRVHNTAIDTDPVHPTMARQEMWNASCMVLIVHFLGIIAQSFSFNYFISVISEALRQLH